MSDSTPLIPRAARRLVLAIAAFLCSALATSAWADPPGRVGRLGEMTGEVWLYTPDVGEWVTAERNRPITTGDRLSTDASARAEVRIGSTTVRLDSGTELEVLRIDDAQISLRLHNGSVSARLRSAEAAREFEMTTAEGRFASQRAGRYRFDRIDESSHLTVWSGEAVYEGPGSALTVYAGQRAEFWLDRDNTAQYSLTEPKRDSFTAWNTERDRYDERSASSRYVSPEMTGAEDLDHYGRWEQAPDHGAVWIPRHVPSGWAPYGAGHWAWVSPWGWTWVDDMPWGFAPFHYGRWVMFNSRWGWVPGHYVRRPVYAPALVGWIGGPHLSVSISVGSRPAPTVGWFPLAPREVYVPYYRVSPGYVQQVNVTHVTHITNLTTIVNNPQQAVSLMHYRNRRFPHAVTVVPRDVMVNRQAVAPVAARMRNTPAVRQLVNQPAQKSALSAPPVAAPAARPAQAAVRRQIHAPDAAPAPVKANASSRAAIVPPPAAQAATRAHVAVPASDKRDAHRHDTRPSQRAVPTAMAEPRSPARTPVGPSAQATKPAPVAPRPPVQVMSAPPAPQQVRPPAATVVAPQPPRPAPQARPAAPPPATAVQRDAPSLPPTMRATPHSAPQGAARGPSSKIQ